MPLQILIVLFCYFQATENILLQDTMVWTDIWVFCGVWKRIWEQNSSHNHSKTMVMYIILQHS